MSQMDDFGVRSRVIAELHPHTEPASAEVSALARATDPAQQAKTAAVSQKTVGGVQWTPALDVLLNQGHKLAGWHAGLQERVVRQVRASAGQAASLPFRAMKAGVQNVKANTAARKAGLPPVTAFGQQTAAPTTPVVGS